MDNQDTPSIDQVINSAMEADSTLNQEKEVEQTNQEPSTTKEEPKIEEESFTAFDPKTAPPELLGVYKQWQKDYTQKRQGEKEYIKGLEEKLSKFEQTGNQTQTIPNQTNPNVVDNIIQTVEQKIQMNQENSYIESNEKEFFNIDSRLNPDSPDHDEFLSIVVGEKLNTMRDEYEAQHNGSVLGFDFKGSTQTLVKSFDEWVSTQNKNFISQQSQNAKANAQKFAKVNPSAKTTSSKPSGKMSLDEAFEKAIDETGTTF